MTRFYGGDDASPRCTGNADAGKRLGNPDIRVPERTEKEDGLCARGAKEEPNADGDEGNENEGTKDRSNTENSKDTLEINGQPRAGRGAEEHELRHVPGWTWLTKGIGNSSSEELCAECTVQFFRALIKSKPGVDRMHFLRRRATKLIRRKTGKSKGGKIKNK
ncbi:hypothetical protein NDU88_000376 [Pleurodeles waltl]|uniref:Uncharacterized protein n=1 Tax=Pleurodeles waltl TaxID=8319 RepID=A0AAV7U3S9_PLEWA|nr:hypothetical protein NDU88_000376 [Pleurodeles waltl]